MAGTLDTGWYLVLPVSKKPMPKPAAWKNTYFWLSAILLVLTVVGLVGGDAAIRDPGQRREDNLWMIYFGAAVIMLVNGWLSHRQTIQHYHEAMENQA